MIGNKNKMHATVGHRSRNILGEILQREPPETNSIPV
jgi:hypothetical protein